MFITVIGGLISIGYTGELIGGNLKEIQLRNMVKDGKLNKMPNEYKNEIVDIITKNVCTAPTPENPYMNWINGDNMDKS